MKIIKYICGHCDNRFEAEEKEGIECPRCFWSSSVIREEDLPKSDTTAIKTKLQGKDGAKRFEFQASHWVGIFFALISLAVLVCTVLFMSHFRGTFAKKGLQFSFPKDDSVASDAHKDGGIPGQPALSPQALLLTAEEQAILDRRLSFSPERPVSEEEKKILENRASVTTGMSESLPSQVFTPEKFKQMLADQERIYRVPLERSYRNKLQEVFNKKYLQAKAAFEAGNLRQARDLWVEALIFPIYGNDIKKHRGVALTMLKPFISDTLSKIGAINHSLVEERVRTKEQEVSVKYQELFPVIAKKDWKEVASRIQGMNHTLDELENPKLVAGETPPYTQTINQVDQDIRTTLFGLLEVIPPPTASLSALRVDIQNKLRVAESFLTIRLDEVQKKYSDAMDAISRKDWTSAKASLKEVDLPLSLEQDAQEKIRVLKKLEASEPQNQNT
ncbi:MAG: hypothetical protein EXS63_07780 [Candidatus Omnitrophica bacterium]|nr:hypothetical protein [Candidatus Omnitrophota bacterium]